MKLPFLPSFTALVPHPVMTSQQQPGPLWPRSSIPIILSLSWPSRSETPPALFFSVHSRKRARWLEPQWLFHSVSHFPYLLPLSCWTGFRVINNLPTQAALSKSLSSLLQASDLLRHLAKHPVHSEFGGTQSTGRESQVMPIRALSEQEEGSLGCISTLLWSEQTPSFPFLQEKHHQVIHPHEQHSVSPSSHLHTKK